MPFGPEEDDLLAEYVAHRAAAQAVDEPWEPPLTVHRQRMYQLHGYDGEVSCHYLLREAGETVGTATWDGSEYDNRDLAWAQVVVAPHLRRRGHGSAALAPLLEECRAAGRPSVLMHGWDTAATRGFAAAHGFAEKATELRRVHELDGSAEQAALFRGLHADASAHASAYELLTATGSTPTELLPGLVDVVAAINDGPLEGLDYEDEVYDVERLRRYEAAQRDSGFRLHRVLARHRESGELAGHTVIVVDAEQPAWGEQHDTAVLPGHRGHRLGLLLKTAMLLHLADAEPGLRRVLTENVASNDAMIAINEALGLRVVGRQLLFQRRLD